MPNPQETKLFTRRTIDGKQYEVPDIRKYIAEHSRDADKVIHAERDVRVKIRKPQPGEQIMDYPIDPKNPGAKHAVDPNNYVMQYVDSSNKAYSGMKGRPYEVTREYLQERYDMPKDDIGDKTVNLRPKEGVQQFIEADRDLMFHDEARQGDTRVFVRKGDYINITDPGSPKLIAREVFPREWNPVMPETQGPGKDGPRRAEPATAVPSQSARMPEPRTIGQAEPVLSQDSVDRLKVTPPKSVGKVGTTVQPLIANAMSGRSRTSVPPIIDDARTGGIRHDMKIDVSAGPGGSGTARRDPVLSPDAERKLKAKPMLHSETSQGPTRPAVPHVYQGDFDGISAGGNSAQSDGRHGVPMPDPVLSPGAIRSTEAKPMRDTKAGRIPVPPLSQQAYMGDFDEAGAARGSMGVTPSAGPVLSPDAADGLKARMIGSAGKTAEAVKPLMQQAYDGDFDGIGSGASGFRARPEFTETVLNAKQDGPAAVAQAVMDEKTARRIDEILNAKWEGPEAVEAVVQRHKDEDAKITDAILNGKWEGGREGGDAHGTSTTASMGDAEMSDAELTDAVLQAKQEGPEAVDRIVQESHSRAQYAQGLQAGHSLAGMPGPGPDAAQTKKPAQRPSKLQPGRSVSDMGLTTSGDSQAQVSM